MSKAEDRELLDTVVLPNGSAVRVTMPTIGEVLALSNQGLNNLQALIVASTGLTVKEFDVLPFIVGVRIVNALKPAFDALTENVVPFNTRLN